MNDLFEITLNDANSRMYRPRLGRAKHGCIRWEAARYVVAGDVQVFNGPHVVVLDPAGAYGVEMEVFYVTHRPIPDRPDHYVKVAKVRAVQVDASVTLRTIVRGGLEMTTQVKAGAYVVQNPDGEQYAMAGDEFHARYEIDI